MDLSEATVAAAERPNVIVIVADDQGWNDVGFHGGDIDPPSLDWRHGQRGRLVYDCSPRW